MAELIISFRGKLTADGDVKVPVIANQHINLIGNEDTGATLFTGGLNNTDVTKVRLANMRGAVTGDYYWPGWASESDGFRIEPIGNGFMANVSITLNTDNQRKRA